VELWAVGRTKGVNKEVKKLKYIKVEIKDNKDIYSSYCLPCQAKLWQAIF